MNADIVPAPPNEWATATATIVVKLGGELLQAGREEELSNVTADVRTLVADGHRVLVVHGGGPQTTELARRLGQEPRIIGGRRITDDGALETLLMVVAGKLNVALVGALTRAGLRAVGLSGVSASLIACRKRPPRVVSGCGDAPIDFGHVGDVESVNVPLLDVLMAAGYTPVLACVGGDADGRAYNINADVVANDLAIAMGADDLMLVTGTPGVLRDIDDPSTRIPCMTVEDGQRAIAEGLVRGGMIPKIEESLRALWGGVRRVHILGHVRPRDLIKARTAPGTIGTTLVGVDLYDSLTPSPALNHAPTTKT